MRNFRGWIGFAVSAVFLYFAFRGLDFDEISEALGNVSYWTILPALFLYFIGVYVRAYRWAVVLKAIQVVSVRTLFPVVVIGYMANNVLPLRAGELVRSYVLGRHTGIRKTSTLATIAVERIFDGITMLGFILIASVWIGLSDQIENVAFLAAALFGGVLIALVLLTTERVYQLLITQIVPRIPEKVRNRTEQMIISLLTGLQILRQKRDLFVVIIASVIAWLFEASMYWVIAQGFDLSLSPATILLVTAVANLATLIPSSPGYVGPFEAGILLVLVGVIGMNRELAISYAIVVHAALYLPITVWGLLYWWRESLSWSEMRTISTERASTQI